MRYGNSLADACPGNSVPQFKQKWAKEKKGSAKQLAFVWKGSAFKK